MDSYQDLYLALINFLKENGCQSVCEMFERKELEMLNKMANQYEQEVDYADDEYIWQK